jgi:hypothetical protein
MSKQTARMSSLRWSLLELEHGAVLHGKKKGKKVQSE